MVMLREISSHYPAAAGCDALYEVSAPGIGLIGVIALHDLSAGPGVGGVRRRRYPSLGAAVVEATALAEQMTLKTALADLPVGGASAALVDREGLDLAAAYEALGRAIEALDGAFHCGADAGTGATELGWIARGTHRVNIPAGHSQASSTAAGVAAAADAALRHLGHDPGAGFSALVQGVGATGSEVALELAAHGARLILTDLERQRAQALLGQIGGATLVDPGLALDQVVDVFAPCAVGTPLTAADVGRLYARVVCGAANQQLAEPCVALELDAAGILYVPDFAANAGAVIEGVVSWLHASDPDVADRVTAAIAAIGPRVAAILDDALAHDCTPLEAALDRIGRPSPSCS